MTGSEAPTWVCEAMDSTVARATQQLADWASALTWADVPAPTRQRLRLVLLDVLGVTLAGSRDPDQRSLVTAWTLGRGPSPLVGAGLSTSVEAAAWLNASALVRLELDEGNKYAKGHPAAHGFPAVLSLAAATNASGGDTLAALVTAYEVASRFGRATTLRPGMHPHGSWGVAGAAAGCARLLRLDPWQTAAAIDAGTGMPVAGHFTSALDGNQVRNAWISAANLSGLAAARMARAGVAANTGTAANTLGELLGTFDPAALTEHLGGRWDVDRGYFKRHAACSFTHPVADAVLTIAGRLSAAEIDAVSSIRVETHSLAARLNRTSWDGRLSAMFSFPFVAAAALIHRRVSPEVSDAAPLTDPRVREAAAKVDVVVAPDLDARLPDERPARVTVSVNGTDHMVEVPNPVGDSAYHPFDESELLQLLTAVTGDASAIATFVAVVDALETVPGVSSMLQRLALAGAEPQSPQDQSTKEATCASTP